MGGHSAVGTVEPSSAIRTVHQSMGVPSIPHIPRRWQIGYNWQTNSWVCSVELDASAAVSEGTNTCLAASGFVVSTNCKAGPNVFATGTGRAGYALGAEGHKLAYMKCGTAWKNNRGDSAAGMFEVDQDQPIRLHDDQVYLSVLTALVGLPHH